jgi:hypothetical protein
MHYNTKQVLSSKCQYLNINCKIKKTSSTSITDRSYFQNKWFEMYNLILHFALLHKSYTSTDKSISYARLNPHPHWNSIVKLALDHAIRIARVLVESFAILQSSTMFPCCATPRNRMSKYMWDHEVEGGINDSSHPCATGL